MSIQDESFPHDDDLELSRSSGKHFVFPHFKPRRSALANNYDNDKDQLAVTNQNISSLSLQDQNESTQSSNDCCSPSETSTKTDASEPNYLQQQTEIKKSEYIGTNSNKSVSYQDIHSEYTKRRYKHVESKVGQYIANIKAQDKKRRSTGVFQRHRSMPETLHGPESTIPKLHNTSKMGSILCRSTNDLDHMHELQDDNELDNFENLTATTSSSSTREFGPDAGIFLDKLTYEQLLNDKERMDYLETKLQEKNADYCRLKQNLDTMRIEYTMCKDKLKQQTQSQRFSGSFGSISAAAALGRNSLQCLLYPQEAKEKSTQTERLLTPSPAPHLMQRNVETYATPLTPESNSSFDHAAMGIMAPAAHKATKTIATIQPLSLNFSNLVEQDSRDFNSSNINNTIGYLRQRSNSIADRKKSTPLQMNISRASSVASSVPNSSDSAIDSELAESPKSQRQSRREEFIYYDKRSQRYAVLETRNAGQTYMATDNLNSSTETNAAEARAVNGHGRNGLRRRQNLRSRMMRFFGSCTKCEDPNLSLDTTQQQSFSQIPLLEKSSQNFCRNVR